MGSSPMSTLMVIPSGIGCSIGGYAGDAIPAARLLAAACGCLITHPNVMNGASLFWRDSRIKYVEGYGLDRFALGEIALRPVRQQKVGLLLDAGLEAELRDRHLQVAEGCRATLGLNIGPVVTTKVPLEVKPCEGTSGASWGELGDPQVLLSAGQLLKESGATAIAVVTRFPDDLQGENLRNYRQGEGVDALAGAEAVVSHLLVKHLGIPCAHSPGLSPLAIDSKLDPRAAGEELGYTFLTCVLVGLSTAPDLVPIQFEFDRVSDWIHVEDLGAVVAPQGALGGAAVLACLERSVPLIAVDNPSVLNVTSNSLGLQQSLQKRKGLQLLSARNYVEAAGLLMLLREGINIDSLRRPFHRLEEITRDFFG